MDTEIEQQINDLINKSVHELKNRILRIVLRNQNKLLKEQERKIKSEKTSKGNTSSKPPVQKSRQKNKDSDYYSD